MKLSRQTKSNDQKVQSLKDLHTEFKSKGNNFMANNILKVLATELVAQEYTLDKAMSEFKSLGIK